MLVGTGIGAGFVRKGKLWRGAREAAGEIGHIVMEIDGPLCGCGNRGCFEALAGRAAIERDIRAAVEAGRTTWLTEKLDGDLSMIRSGALRDALAAGDELVTEIMRKASVVIGNACLTIRHLIDPEVIVLGGGVVDACDQFMLPIIREIVEGDQLLGARPGGYVRLSALGDDAVVLGAVALARQMVGRNPFKKKYRVMPSYPKIVLQEGGVASVGKKTFEEDFVIYGGGKAKLRKKNLKKQTPDALHSVTTKEIGKLCRGGPEIVFIGTGSENTLDVPEIISRYLQERLIKCEVLPTPEAVQAFNRCDHRKAGLFHLKSSPVTS